MPNGRYPSPGRAKEEGLAGGKILPSDYDSQRGSPGGFPGAGAPRGKEPAGTDLPYTTPPKNAPLPYGK